MGRNLPAKDNDGKSDQFSFCGEKKKSEIIENTINPEWYETINMTVAIPQPTKPDYLVPRMKCTVYDCDYAFEKTNHHKQPNLSENNRKYKSRDYMGHFYIEFKDIKRMMHQKKPEWHQLLSSENQNLPIPNAKIYCAMEFVKSNHYFDQSKRIFRIQPRTRYKL